jgi:hypothetical protein
MRKQPDSLPLAGVRDRAAGSPDSGGVGGLGFGDPLLQEGNDVI